MASAEMQLHPAAFDAPIATSTSSPLPPITPSTPLAHTLQTTDLLHHILSYLDRKSWIKCLTVNKAFYNQAGPLLYHTIHFTREDQLQTLYRNCSTGRRQTRSDIKGPIEKMPLLVHTKHLEISQMPRGISQKSLGMMTRKVFPGGVQKVSIQTYNGACGYHDRTPCIATIIPWLEPNIVDIGFSPLFDTSHSLLDPLALESFNFTASFHDMTDDSHIAKLHHATSKTRLISLRINSLVSYSFTSTEILAQSIAAWVKRCGGNWEIYMADCFAPFSRTAMLGRAIIHEGFDLTAEIIKRIGDKDKSRKVKFIDQPIKPIETYACLLQPWWGAGHPEVGFYGSWIA